MIRVEIESKPAMLPWLLDVRGSGDWIAIAFQYVPVPNTPLSPSLEVSIVHRCPSHPTLYSITAPLSTLSRTTGSLTACWPLVHTVPHTAMPKTVSGPTGASRESYTGQRLQADHLPQVHA